MKIFITLIVILTIFGVASGFFYIKQTPTSNNKKPINNNTKATIDETSVPPVDPETNKDLPDFEITTENFDKYIIKGKNNNYLLYLPEQCTTDKIIITCKNKTEFTLEQITDSTNFTKPFVSSETFLIGDFELLINIKETETLITIKGQDTIYLLAKGAGYKEISDQLFNIISTFSVVNPAP